MELNKPRPWVAKKYLDEGTASPFPARLMLQTFHFRDNRISGAEERVRFDRAYSPLLDNFVELKVALKNLTLLFEQHLSEVDNGSAAQVHPSGQISVLKPIDIQYRALMKDFFIKGQMVISAIP